MIQKINWDLISVATAYMFCEVLFIAGLVECLHQIFNFVRGYEVVYMKVVEGVTEIGCSILMVFVLFLAGYYAFLMDEIYGEGGKL